MSSSAASKTDSAVTNRMVLFNRREIKYLVDRTTRTALTEDLKALMRPDSYSQEGGRYYVRSLYFDTDQYLAYHEKLAGAAIRHKLRIRAYGINPRDSTYVRLEVKSSVTNRMVLFNRREIKYLVDRTTRTALTEDLKALMRPDSYSQEGGRYYVRSLYFDTDQYLAYHEKLAGIGPRIIF